jgi:hypothetical protein
MSYFCPFAEFVLSLLFCPTVVPIFAKNIHQCEECQLITSSLAEQLKLECEEEEQEKKIA